MPKQKTKLITVYIGTSITTCPAIEEIDGFAITAAVANGYFDLWHFESKNCALRSIGSIEEAREYIKRIHAMESRRALQTEIDSIYRAIGGLEVKQFQAPTSNSEILNIGWCVFNNQTWLGKEHDREAALRARRMLLADAHNAKIELYQLGFEIPYLNYAYFISEIAGGGYTYTCKSETESINGGHYPYPTVTAANAAARRAIDEQQQLPDWLQPPKKEPKAKKKKAPGLP